jgi:hypothetical protein
VARKTFRSNLPSINNAAAARVQTAVFGSRINLNGWLSLPDWRNDGIFKSLQMTARRPRAPAGMAEKPEKLPP